MNVRKPLLLVALPYLAFFITLLLTYDRLPEPLASHFDARGVPNGWTTRATYLAGMIGSAIFLPALVVGLCFAFRYFPDSMINLPNRDFWLAPGRRAETNAHLFHHSFLFACLAILFMLGIHLSLVEANSHQPPRLSLSLIILTGGTFLVGVIAWALLLLWPFLKKVSRQEPSTAREIGTP